MPRSGLFVHEQEWSDWRHAGGFAFTQSSTPPLTTGRFERNHEPIEFQNDWGKRKPAPPTIAEAPEEVDEEVAKPPVRA